MEKETSEIEQEIISLNYLVEDIDAIINSISNKTLIIRSIPINSAVNSVNALSVPGKPQLPFPASDLGGRLRTLQDRLTNAHTQLVFLLNDMKI